jgi:aspartate/methionine/tyrosine aminotransferase
MACALVTHAQVSSLTAIAATSLLSPDILFKFLQENKSRIRSAYNEIRDWLSARKIQYISANAGLYIFVRLCDSDDEKAEKALEEQIARVGVRVVRGTNYFCKEPGWFRLVFTLEAEKMRESLNRLDGVLRGL